jgi:hypothetical protein
MRTQTSGNDKAVAILNIAGFFVRNGVVTLAILGLWVA